MNFFDWKYEFSKHLGEFMCIDQSNVKSRSKIENEMRSLFVIPFTFLTQSFSRVILIALFCDNSVPNTSWKHHNLEPLRCIDLDIDWFLRMRYEIERITVVIVYRRANVFLIRICSVIISCETLIFIRCLSCLLCCDASLIDADLLNQLFEQHYQ